MENNKLKQSDFFVGKEAAKTPIPMEKVVDKIPGDYAKVKLDSCGQLNYPKELYFRNYNMENLSWITSVEKSKHVDQLEAIIKALNDMVWGDFRCENLHSNDLYTILLTLQIRWGSAKITIPYLLDDTLPSDKLYEKDNIDYVSLVPTDIKTKPIELDPECKEGLEPLNVRIGDKTVSFRLERIGDLLTINKYIEDKYYHEGRKYSDIADSVKQLDYYRQLIEKAQIELDQLREKLNKPIKELKIPGSDKTLSNEEDIESTKALITTKEMMLNSYKDKHNLLESQIDRKLFNEYVKFAKEQAMETVLLSQAIKIVAVDGKKCETFEDKINALKLKIDGRFFLKLNKEIIPKVEDWGIIKTLKFKSKKLKKVVNRRLQFRLFDFIPSLELPSNCEITVTYG